MTRAPVKKKCKVRADCWPPKTLTAAGIAETKEGDMARPVQIISGNRTKIMSRYAMRCNTLYDQASSAPGRAKRKCCAMEIAMLRNGDREARDGDVRESGQQILPKMPLGESDGNVK